jgi:hypothetical protein
MSSQYAIKDVIVIGGNLLSVVDRGWVEIRTGQGSLNRVMLFNTAVLPLNTNTVPLLLMVGRIMGLLVYIP